MSLCLFRERDFLLLIRSRHGPVKNPARRSRLGLLYYVIISLLYLHYLGEAVDVADILVMLVVGHVEGRQVARGSNVATTGGGDAQVCAN
jgi:hypothetical protein